MKPALGGEPRRLSFRTRRKEKIRQFIFLLLGVAMTVVVTVRQGKSLDLGEHHLQGLVDDNNHHLRHVKDSHTVQASLYNDSSLKSDPQIGGYDTKASPGAGQNEIKTDFSAVLCLTAKDPQLYLEEWVDYHFGLGFTGLHIFDNSPDNNLRDWNKDNYEDDSRINITHWIPNIIHNITDPKEAAKQQEKAYFECVQQARRKNVQWIANFDVDEFLVLKKHNSVQELLQDHCVAPHCGQLSVNWVFFGSSNRERYTPAPVTQRFVYKNSVTQATIKVIVAPDAVDPSFPWWQHSFPLQEGRNWLDTNGKVIKNKGYKRMQNYDTPDDVAVLNHYKYLSQEEWDHKNCVRGDIMNKKSKAKECNTTVPLIGDVYDDSAWKLLLKVAPKYQMYQNVTDLG